MKWTYHIAQKMKIAASMTFVIILVLATNFLNKSHFSDLQESFTSVYKDRLMAEIYIFNFTRLLNQKSQLLLDSVPFDHPTYYEISDSINATIKSYDATFLTEKEAHIYKELKLEFMVLDSLENQYKKELNANQKQLLASAMIVHHSGLLKKLEQLSEIQKEEGKRLIDASNKIVASSKLTLQLELVILIVIGVFIQALIFSAKTIVPKIDQHHNLN